MSHPLPKKILYIEDDPDIRAIACLTLEELGGFQVEACASGREALERAAGFGPELIILDVMMPGMDGPTTLARLRELPVTAATPAIFMTAKVQTQEVTEYRAKGALDVIAKPFDPMSLPQQVEAIWRRYHGG